eukprot:3419602-Prorocentrum_lima.AAC.1
MLLFNHKSRYSAAASESVGGHRASPGSPVLGAPRSLRGATSLPSWLQLSCNSPREVAKSGVVGAVGNALNHA